MITTNLQCLNPYYFHPRKPLDNFVKIIMDQEINASWWNHDWYWWL